MGSGSDYIMIDILVPGQKAPFDILLDDPPGWVSYEFVVTWSVTSEWPPSLLIKNVTSHYDSWGDFHVLGEIENISGATVDFVKAVVTLYDSSGGVAFADYSYANPYTLNPGMAGSFDVEFWCDLPPFTDYVVQPGW